VLQVIQSYRSGEVAVHEVPAPTCPRNGLLVRTTASLISIGTERGMIELGRKSLLGKARARPDLAKRALEKARREGFWKTFQESLARLDTPVPLGYSSAGIVLEAGESAHGFAPGDRVACVGAGFGSHAEFTAVPVNMACRIPDNVTDEEAAFVMLGAIAMHGVREAQLTPGSTVVVLGLGLLGLITVQLLRAYGCRVLAMDPDNSKSELARAFGASEVTTTNEAITAAVQNHTHGIGADAVLVVVASKSDEPVNLAVALSRPKARIVVVGVADIHPSRNEMWHKEVEIVVSKAGGQGALDPVYELDGIDIPVQYARWTQLRNVEEFLRLSSEGLIDLKKLITHRLPIAAAQDAYDKIVKGTLTGAIGVLLQYPPIAEMKHTVTLAKPGLAPVKGALRLGVVGAGQYGRTTFLPVLAKAKELSLQVLATSTGSSAEHSGKRYGFAECSTDGDAVFARADVDAIMVLTPHSRHKRDVLAAISAGKHVFIEKPLCVAPEELREIETALSAATKLPVVMVGHNRRYSPHTRRIAGWLRGRREPLVMSIRVNAGYVPANHWVHSESQGRSRIVGEMTHFFDLAEAVACSAITEVSAMRIDADDKTTLNNDNVSINLRFADGSVCALVYSAQGPRNYPREHLEVFSGGSAVVSADFRNTVFYGPSKNEKFVTSQQAYGYAEEIEHFTRAARGEVPVEPGVDAVLRIMKVAFAAERSLATGQPVALR
jgi:predicted dehydrogenase/threonine dehydrogenase-like Zn-dependent dehydrogenase